MKYLSANPEAILILMENICLTSVTVHCGPIPDVVNAYHDGYVNMTYPSEVTYNCTTNYIITGNETISCLSNGNWTLPDFQCQLRELFNIIKKKIKRLN